VKHKEGMNIIMPYAEDGTFHRYMQNNHGKITPAQRKLLKQDLKDALDHIHNRGYSHNDIKTDNILVVDENGRKTLKLADFGGATKFDANNQGQTDNSVAEGMWENLDKLNWS
jgi:serine/threonine protein kinase